LIKVNTLGTDQKSNAPIIITENDIVITFLFTIFLSSHNGGVGKRQPMGKLGFALDVRFSRLLFDA
jgi:hypothetical protein